jgi:hypothetical protein
MCDYRRLPCPTFGFALDAPAVISAATQPYLLRRKHRLKRTENISHRARIDFSDALAEARTIDSPQLIENNGRRPATVAVPRNRNERIVLLIGAMTNRSRRVLSSSGDTTTHGRVFWTSVPTVGSSVIQ